MIDKYTITGVVPGRAGVEPAPQGRFTATVTTTYEVREVIRFEVVRTEDRLTPKGGRFAFGGLPICQCLKREDAERIARDLAGGT